MFSSVLERPPKIGFYRLPTHRRGAHRNFFPSYFKIEILAVRDDIVTLGHKGLTHAGITVCVSSQDGFVLVGSVGGQRYWSLMLNIDAVISAGGFAPHDQQVSCRGTGGGGGGWCEKIFVIRM